MSLYGDDISLHYQISAVGRRGQDGNICESTALVTYSIGVQCHLHTAEDDGLHAGFTILGSLGSIEFTSNPWLSESQANPFTVSLYEQPSEVIDVEVVVDVEAKGNGFYYQVEVVLHMHYKANNTRRQDHSRNSLIHMMSWRCLLIGIKQR
ncbi:MAG: hypothetical protein ACJAUL_003095 [Paraglaciecola sp.]